MVPVIEGLPVREAGLSLIGVFRLLFGYDVKGAGLNLPRPVEKAADDVGSPAAAAGFIIFMGLALLLAGLGRDAILMA